MTQETFERELSRRADAVHGAPLSFEDVRGRAVSIRRRRRAAVAGGIAAAVALVVLVPTLLSGGTGPKSEAPDPAPPTPGHTAVLHDGTLTRPDGATVALDVDNADVGELGVLTDGRIVVAMSGRPEVRVYAPDGTLQEEYAVQSNSITMSAGDDAVAWIGEDFRSRVLVSGAAEPLAMDGVPMPGESPGSIDAVLDGPRLLVGDWNTTGYSVTADGREELTTSEPLRITDVNADGSIWAVQYQDAADPQFGCVGLYDPEAAAMLARSCESSGLRFSPDGQHLLGMRGDNNMSGDATVFDLDLVPVWHWESAGEGDVISRAAWDDAGNLLVAWTNWRTGRWSVERVDIGSKDVETVVPDEPGRNPEMVAEFVLSE
jgi:hypothetical protein